MQPYNIDKASLSQAGLSALASHRVLRNTYFLLSLTLIFSAGCATLAMMTEARPMGFLPLMVIYIGLLMLINFTRNSIWGIVSVFALTGFLGYTLGPLLNGILHSVTNGGQIIATAFGGTGLIFMGLSGYALTSKRDFSPMAKGLTIGLLVAFVLGIAGIFFHLTALQLAVSAMFIVLSSGVILFQTSSIINGGETNYVMATVTLYVSLFNIFVNLLQLLSAFSSRD
ncbi:MAG: Bax inhibitor-1/YccA family protein [Gammaproteobacteria bacterium]